MRLLKSVLILCMGVVFFIGCNKEHISSGNVSVENEIYTNELSAEEAIDLLKIYVKELSDSPQTRSTEHIKITSICKESYSYSLMNTRSGFNQDENIKIPVYNFELQEGKKEGFALLVGDKRFPKLLAYVENGSLSDTTFNIGLKEWSRQIPDYLLELYDDSLDEDKIYGLSEGSPINEIKDIDGTSYPYGYQAIYKYSDELYYKFVNALVVVNGSSQKDEDFIKTQWNQQAPYNNKVAYLPSNCSKSGRGSAGCVPVATAQIIAHLAPSSSKYNWTLLKSSPKIETSDNVRAEQVSSLIKEFHDLTKPRIDCDGTSNSSDDIVKILNHMGLKVTKVENVKDTLNLLQTVPFIMSGQTDQSEGHAYIIDGRRKIDILIQVGKYHIKNSRDGAWGPEINK